MATRSFRSRPLIWLAVLGWLAQLLLPVSMSLGSDLDDGAKAWCGNPSPALAARIAALPDDLRGLIGQGLAHGRAQVHCLAGCQHGAGAPPPASVAPEVARFSVIRVANARPVPAAGAPHSSPPATRGPPAIS